MARKETHLAGTVGPSPGLILGPAPAVASLISMLRVTCGLLPPLPPPPEGADPAAAA